MIFSKWEQKSRFPSISIVCVYFSLALCLSNWYIYIWENLRYVKCTIEWLLYALCGTLMTTVFSQREPNIRFLSISRLSLSLCLSTWYIYMRKYMCMIEWRLYFCALYVCVCFLRCEEWRRCQRFLEKERFVFKFDRSVYYFFLSWLSIHLYNYTSVHLCIYASINRYGHHQHGWT